MKEEEEDDGGLGEIGVGLGPSVLRGPVHHVRQTTTTLCLRLAPPRTAPVAGSAVCVVETPPLRARYGGRGATKEHGMKR